MNEQLAARNQLRGTSRDREADLLIGVVVGVARIQFLLAVIFALLTPVALATAACVRRRESRMHESCSRLRRECTTDWRNKNGKLKRETLFPHTYPSWAGRGCDPRGPRRCDGSGLQVVRKVT